MKISNNVVNISRKSNIVPTSRVVFGNSCSAGGPRIDEFKKIIADSNLKRNIIKANRKKRLKQAGIGVVAGLGTVATILGTIVFSSPSNDKPEQKFPVNDTKPGIIENIPDDFFPEFPSFQINEHKKAKDVLKTDETINLNFNQLKSAVDRFSSQLSYDAYSLITERVEELGNNRVDPIDVAKILWIESKGRIYSEDDPTKIIESHTGEAFGPFQITQGAADFINSYYGLMGTENELDLMDPYDNLDICILYLRYMQYERGKDIQEGVALPTGDNVDLAVAWGYHDGAWAEKITKQGQNYLDQYQSLSHIDEYPEVIDYFFDQDTLS